MADRLFRVTTTNTLGGVSSPAKHGNTIVYRADEKHTNEQRDKLNKGFANILLGLMTPEFGIFSACNSMLPAPGTNVANKKGHYTTPIEDVGKRPVQNGKSIEDLSVCVALFKAPDGGDAGELLVRGCFYEGEAKTNDQGLLEKPAAADVTRFNNAAKAIFDLFKTEGAKGLVMLGPSEDENAGYVPMATWVDSARLVLSMKFLAIVKRQTTKQNTSLEADSYELLKKRKNQLKRAYAEAKKYAGSAALDADAEEPLYELGGDIFSKHTIQERQRVKIPKYLTKYVKKPSN